MSCRLPVLHRPASRYEKQKNLKLVAEDLRLPLLEGTSVVLDEATSLLAMSDGSRGLLTTVGLDRLSGLALRDGTLEVI